MSHRIQIRETGEVLDCPDVEIVMAQPRYTLDGHDLSVADALSRLLALRDYWKARAIRFETTLADSRAES